jgi:hypothetical protein
MTLARYTLQHHRHFQKKLKKGGPIVRSPI